MTEWEELMAEDWAVIERLLPDGWEEKAEELGAWERVRGFRNKEVLLRTLLVHIGLGCSLKETAVRAEGSRLCRRFIRCFVQASEEMR